MVWCKLVTKQLMNESHYWNSGCVSGCHYRPLYLEVGLLHSQDRLDAISLKKITTLGMSWYLLSLRGHEPGYEATLENTMHPHWTQLPEKHSVNSVAGTIGNESFTAVTGENYQEARSLIKELQMLLMLCHICTHFTASDADWTFPFTISRHVLHGSHTHEFAGRIQCFVPGRDGLKDSVPFSTSGSIMWMMCSACSHGQY